MYRNSLKLLIVKCVLFVEGSSIKEDFKPNNLDGTQTKVENRQVIDCELQEKVSNKQILTKDIWNNNSLFKAFG